MLPSVFIDGVPADQIGAVEELSFSRSFGGGQGGGLRDLKLTLDLDGYDHHPSLRLHAPVDLRHGAESLGEGRIVSIDRDTWEIVVDGIVRLGEDYECRGADSEPASLAVGLPLAIGRGLPWVIPDGLVLPTDVPESMQTITEALNAWVALTDRAWLLDGRTLTVAAEPTAPTLILTATDNPNSSTDGLVTSVTAKYAGAVDEQGRPALISYVTVAADNVPKHVERTIDLTGEGALTEEDAANRARSQLVAGTTATLTESVAVAEGALTMHDGKDLSEVLCTVREGQMVRQLDWINPDGSPGLYCDWIIGGVDWSLDDGLVLTPLGAEASTLAGAIIDIRRGIADAQEAADDAQGGVETVTYGLADLDADLTELNEVTLPAVQQDIADAELELGALNGKFPITSTNISDNAITTPKILAGAVNADRIASNAVTAAKIVGLSITGDKIAANTIGAGKITALSIGAAELAAGAVTADKIVAGAITAAKIDANAVTGKNITGCTITGGTITSVNTFQASEVVATHVAILGQLPTKPGVGLGVNYGIESSAAITGLELYSTSDTGTGAADAEFGSGGRVKRKSSTRRVKEDIEPMTLDEARKILAAEEATFYYRDREQYGDRRYSGGIAEQFADAGLDLWVTRDAAGEPDGIRYAELTIPLIAIARDHEARIAALEAAA